MRRVGGSRWMAGLLAGAFVVGLAGVRPAFGQGAPEAAEAPAVKPSTATDEEVARLYKEGMEAAQAGDWEKSRELLEKAYKLKKHWKIAANLGKAEAKLGRDRDAAEHLEYFLHVVKLGEIPPADRQEAQELLDKARLKVGRVTVMVDVQGADVLVDGKGVGTSPFEVPVYVLPGKHVVEVKKKGFKTEKEEVEVGVGGARTAVFELKEQGHAVGGGFGAGGAMGSEGGAGEGTKYPTELEPTWKPWTIGISVGFAVSGLGVGIGFTVAANAKSTDANKKLTELKGMGPQKPGQTRVCPDTNGCADLEAILRDWDRWQDIAVVGYVVGGVAATGAVIAALWPTERPKKSIQVQVSPVFAPTERGLLVRGAF